MLVEGSTQDGEKFSELIEKINLKRPLLSKLKYDHRLQGRQIPLRIPVQHEERNEAVENDDESYYQTVPYDRNHSSDEPTMRNYLLDSTDSSSLSQAVGGIRLQDPTEG